MPRPAPPTQSSPRAANRPALAQCARAKLLGEIGLGFRGNHPAPGADYVQFLELPAQHSRLHGRLIETAAESEGSGGDEVGGEFRVSGEREEKWPPEFRPYTDLSTMLVLLDTGATLTHCSKRFVQLNGGEVEFRLVGQDSPKFRCSVVVDHGFRDDGGLGYVELAYLGMDSLLEFAAVGWSLAPLTVYFLPRDGEEQVEEVGVGITGSGLRVRSPYR